MRIIWTREDIEEELSRKIVIHKIPRTKKKKVKQKKLREDYVPVCDDCHNEIHRMINSAEAKLKNAHKILKSKK